MSGATNVDTNPLLSIRFSEDIDPASITEKSLLMKGAVLKHKLQGSLLMVFPEDLDDGKTYKYHGA